MSAVIDNKDGRRWARFTLLLALFISMAGNVTHTFLADSDISLVLRVPPAALWPIFTFLGIEVLVRIIWQPGATHNTARALVLFPAVPAAIVSYEHLYSLLLLMGEEKFIAAIGPAAIDGAMIGMTIVLLTTRKLPASSGQQIVRLDYARPIGPMPAPYAPPAMQTVEQELERMTLADVMSAAPVSPAPTVLGFPVRTDEAMPLDSFRLEQPKKERASRVTSVERERKVLDMLADPELKASDSTMRRYARVARILKDSPQADIDYKKENVQSGIVEQCIRPWANLERVR